MTIAREVTPPDDPLECVAPPHLTSNKGEEGLRIHWVKWICTEGKHRKIENLDQSNEQPLKKIISINSGLWLV